MGWTWTRGRGEGPRRARAGAAPTPCPAGFLGCPWTLVPCLSLPGICLGAQDRCLCLAYTVWPHPRFPVPIRIITDTDDINSMVRWSPSPRLHPMARRLTSQVDKLWVLGPLDTFALSGQVPSKPSEVLARLPAERPSHRWAALRRRAGSCRSCQQPGRFSRGPGEWAPLHCQLALKMVRAYAVLFLFFNKINIKNFFNRAPGTTESN